MNFRRIDLQAVCHIPRILEEIITYDLSLLVVQTYVCPETRAMENEIPIGNPSIFRG